MAIASVSVLLGNIHIIFTIILLYSMKNVVQRVHVCVLILYCHFVVYYSYVII